MTTLIIDCRLRDEIKIGLNMDKNTYFINKKGNRKSQIILTAIDELLTEKKMGLKDLNAIKVSTKSESFTGLRVGISVANALSFSLGIPVNGKRLGNLAKPVYSR